MKKLIIPITLLVIISIACKKKKEEKSNSELATEILTDFTNKVAIPQYAEIKKNAEILDAKLISFNTTPSEQNLTDARTAWKNLRESWEKCESYLFGPVATNEYDPQMDTWPMNNKDLDAVLNSNTNLNQQYISTLDHALRGFHPIEYLIFGINGNKIATSFTNREKEYLIALSTDLKMTCSQLSYSWEVNGENYGQNLIDAGIEEKSSIYTTKKEAILEIVNGMIGICDEVANGKIAEPFDNQNPELEESKYSANSFTDFKNNMIGVQNCYTGKYIEDGKGIDELVKEYNKSLDAKINSQIATAINSFNSFSVSFGLAITSEKVQITNTQTAINDLKTTLESELLPLIQERIKN